MTARVILDGPVDRENVNSREFYSTPEDTRTDSDSWRGSHLVCNDASPRRLPRNEMEDALLAWRNRCFYRGRMSTEPMAPGNASSGVSELNRSRAVRVSMSSSLELIPLNSVFP